LCVLIEPSTFQPRDPYNEIADGRTSMSGTASSGRKPISERFPVYSDSFHRLNVPLLPQSSCKRDLSCKRVCVYVSLPLIEVRLYLLS
jgi:hypothetical protein